VSILTSGGGFSTDPQRTNSVPQISKPDLGEESTEKNVMEEHEIWKCKKEKEISIGLQHPKRKFLATFLRRMWKRSW